MSADLLLALVTFAFVTSVTPGPNNLMLMASGANFGLRRTLPHMAGVALGFAAMTAGVGLGVMGLFEVWPPAFTVLKLLAVAYMLWLGWKIATTVPPEGRPAASGRPLTFVEAAAFQWVNPKAWAMAVTAVTAYAPGRGTAAVLTVAAVFALVNLPSVGLWALMGRAVRRLLSRPGRLRAFNFGMAGLLLASLVPVLARTP